ncbi:hypothetical protein [Roseomonas fluvialis]|uniref:Lipoprotein n=1 Tax=Roseomonas fluvialis TaxID=1750527 RepID=A0ABN6P1B2_9PROT|nr:hypothetical protein [Roseomonas fluvialis]BDG71768.1 hypothetical protein Rmf_16970 [Roseomonas fluvialis]
MRTILPIAAAVLLAACSSMDTHRMACSDQLGLAPSIAVKDSAETEPDPAVESCAAQRRLAEERAVGQGIAVGLGAVAVGAVLGASSGHGRPAPRGYRRAYRRGW